MCGIYSILNNSKESKKEIIKYFMKGKSRGPDNSVIHDINNGVLGFHRLSINGLNKGANQPLCNEDIMLICNGEIYNYKELYKEHENDFINSTDSDCEIIIHLYKKYGIEKTLNMIDGVYAFILYDKSKIYVARDIFGVRPLFRSKNNEILEFASDVKQMMLSDIEQFPPGYYESYEIDNDIWYKKYSKSYSSHNNVVCDIKYETEESILNLIERNLEKAVEKRVKTTDRPVACLLSGGLDSSLITALVNKYYKKGVLETYSIGMPGSEDLKYAKIVADYLGTNHNEIIINEDDFIKAIPEVIKNIETYDETTVRASIGNYLIGKYISENSESKVIFNGDGSDEICGGYMYFHYTKNSEEFDVECKRLLDDIRYFDVLRSDKSISSNGLEPRTPFLDKKFVFDYLKISKDIRFDLHHKHCEKYLLRKSFENKGLLPNEVLWRTKEAFSDGVTSKKTGLFELIPEYVKKNNLANNEKEYYVKLFTDYFGKNRMNIIPYKWMPKFLDISSSTTDSSARTLKIYKKKQ